MRPRLAALVLWAGVLYCVAPANAQMPAPGPNAGLVFDCGVLADFVARFTAFRDAGADQAKTLALFRSGNREMPEPRKAVVEREIRRMWGEGLDRPEAEFQLFLRCQAQHGDMGREI